MKNFTKDLFSEVKNNSLSEASAALAFHTFLMLAPILVFVVAFLGFIFGREEMEIFVFSFLEGHFGMEVTVVETAVEGAFNIMTNTFLTVVGLLVALYAGVSLVNHARATFFKIFNVEVSAANRVLATFKERALSFGYAVLFFLSIVILVLGHGAVAFVFNTIRDSNINIIPAFILEIIQFSVLFAIIFFLFSVVYRFMSAGSISWKGIFTGAAVSSFMFTLFNIFLSIYVTYSFKLLIYGASSFILIILVWVYFSAFTLFFGAVFSKVYEKIVKGRRNKNVYL